MFISFILIYIQCKHYRYTPMISYLSGRWKDKGCDALYLLGIATSLFVWCPLTTQIEGFGGCSLSIPHNAPWLGDDHSLILGTPEGVRVRLSLSPCHPLYDHFCTHLMHIMHILCRNHWI
jgi:hypothetical protein